MKSSLPLVLVLALSAACSSNTVTTDPPPSGAAAEATPTEPPPADDGTTEPSKTPPLRDAIDPSILSALKGANIDIAALPDDLEEIAKSPAKLKAVMKTFTIALGTTCEGCHAKSGTKIDYEAATPKKNVAKKMWTDLVRGLQKKDGKPLYCDSCHQGKMEFLDRADDKALGAWMKNNFVDKLARRDGAEHGCATCHGEPFKGEILDGWSK
ncbi:MAG: hypothetical protein JWP87_4071 [Labilithrix sp.]|nr:hypothetical protein [Labilithrix sp.]